MPEDRWGANTTTTTMAEEFVVVVVGFLLRPLIAAIRTKRNSTARTDDTIHLFSRRATSLPAEHKS
jgi:hypothetical protein